MRRFAALFLAALGCYGQIHDLATTDDGGQLYFISEQRLKGTNLVNTQKVFRYVNGAVELFEYSPRTISPHTTLSSLSCCDLEWPEVSGDGRLVAFTSVTGCSGGSSCLINYYPEFKGQIRGTVENSFNDGRIRLSPDGRYVLRFIPNLSFYTASIFVTLGDLVAGSDAYLYGYRAIGDGKQNIASDGTVLLDSNNMAVLWKAGTVRPLKFSIPTLARMDSSASLIVQESGVARRLLIAFDVASGQQINLAQSTEPVPSTSAFFRPSLSSDGLLVAYLDKGPDGIVQAYLQRTDGTGKRVLTKETRGVTEVVLSGFGNVAYAVGDAGRLLKIDIASSEVTELAKPALDLENYSLVPGGLLIAPRATLPPEATGITINGRAAPLVVSDSHNFVIQTPWETEPGNEPVVRASGVNTPFESATPHKVYSANPDFYFLGRSLGGYVLAAHEDFSGLVTFENPAKAGEVVHIFLTGLGEVSPPVATGAVTPSDTLHRAVASIDCNFQILFAGLAPGFIGLNQMDVRLPNPIPYSYPVLACKVSERSCAGCAVTASATIAAK